MNKKVCLILSILSLLQIFYITPMNQVQAAPPTKTMTHTIIQPRYTNSKTYGQSYYDYDDGIWYGRLYRTTTTWEFRRESGSEHRTGYRDSEFDEANPSSIWSFSYMKNLVEEDGYTNVEMTSMSWNGGCEGPGKFTFQVHLGDGEYETRGPYKYRRSFIGYYQYDGYRYTSNYSGTIKARTNLPTVTIDKNIFSGRYHNQDIINVEGFIKDIDIGDKLSVLYTIDGINHTDNNIIMNPTEIISTGNDTYFRGYIQLDQTITSGTYTLKIWGRDDKGADSDIFEIPITIYNVLEEVINSLKNYTLKNELQFMVVNSNVPIIKSTINDDLIKIIKNELNSKYVKLYFIGTEESKIYINNYLLGN